MQNIQNMYMGVGVGAKKLTAFSPSAKSGSAPSTRRKCPTVQCKIRL